MTITTEIKCHQCGKVFSTYDELADHIIMGGASHKKSKRWALKYKARNLKRTHVEFKKVADDPDEEKTEYGNEQRENMKRKLSGETKYIMAVCPKCHKMHRPLVECEFVESPVAWRINGTLVRVGDCCKNFRGR